MLPPGEAEAPLVLSRRAILLRRLGDGPGARALAARLDRIGYRHPEYVKAFNQGATMMTQMVSELRHDAMTAQEDQGDGDGEPARARAVGQLRR